jgi:hypothetical protein
VSGRLGCAESYQAAIYTTAVYWWHDTSPGNDVWRQRTGQRLFDLEAVTDAKWERLLNNQATAEVTVSKRMLSDACCQQLSLVEPWMHELALFRDGQMVWQGPVIQTVETAGEWVVKARDVSAWLDVWQVGAPNIVMPMGAPGVPSLHTRYLTYGPADAVAVYKAVLDDSMKLLTSSFDLPQLQANVQYVYGAATTSFRPDPTASLGESLRSLSDATIDTTVIGRATVVMPTGYTFGAAVASLSEQDFGTELEVTADGDALATDVWITGADYTPGDPDDGGVYAGGASANGFVYGTIIRYMEMPGVADNATLTNAAKRILAQVNPVPVVLRVPDEATLTPGAPVTVEELVPSSRIDVALTEGWCRPVRQTHRLVRVTGTWQQGEGERIGVSLVSATDPAQPR